MSATQGCPCVCNSGVSMYPQLRGVHNSGMSTCLQLRGVNMSATQGCPRVCNSGVSTCLQLRGVHVSATHGQEYVYFQLEVLRMCIKCRDK